MLQTSGFLNYSHNLSIIYLAYDWEPALAVTFLWQNVYVFDTRCKDLQNVVMMMDDNNVVKAGREFQTIKDTGVKAQMEGVKWLLATITPPAHFGK